MGPALVGAVVFHPLDAAAAPTDGAAGTWPYLLTLLVPFVVALINRPGWSSNVKRGVQVAVSVAFTVIVMALNGEFASGVTMASLATYAVAIVGGAQIWYGVLKATRPGAEALDAAERSLTGPGKSPA